MVYQVLSLQVLSAKAHIQVSDEAYIIIWNSLLEIFCL